MKMTTVIDHLSQIIAAEMSVLRSAEASPNRGADYSDELIADKRKIIETLRRVRNELEDLAVQR